MKRYSTYVFIVYYINIQGLLLDKIVDDALWFVIIICILFHNNVNDLRADRLNGTINYIFNIIERPPCVVEHKTPARATRSITHSTESSSSGKAIENTARV